VSSESISNPSPKNELLTFELDLDLTLTDLSISNLCDPFDANIRSGPVSILQ